MTPKNIILNPPAEFLQPEERCGCQISADMKAVWAVEIDMVSQLLDVCKRHNLRIYADGGTLLGAIRHKGYIPWDDDIDMVMMREDYDKLMQLGDEFKHPYFLQTIYSDRHCTHRYAQLRHSLTACWASEGKRCPHKYNQGIFIDIFPADNVPTTARSFAHYYKKEGVARQRVRLLLKLLNLMPERVYSYLRDHTKALSDKVQYARYEDVLRSVPTKEEGCVCEIAFKHSSMISSYSDFGEPQWVDFEYIKVPIPQNAHHLLALQYGADYMTPIQGLAQHGGLCFDTENSYKQ
jgi:lipopolysaccharide cholinephosphotransferase